jgi:uncharacterized membrane protein
VEQIESEKSYRPVLDVHGSTKRSVLDDVPKRGHRVVGIDMARSLAIFLMVIENYKNAMQAHGDGPRWLVWFFSHIEGRAAPAFVTLMGVGLALLTNKALESDDPAPRWDSISRIIKRGIFLVAVGVFHYQLWPGDILHFYGFYMALCALLLFRPSWAPLAAAALVLIVAYVINQTFNDEVGWENGYIWYNGYLTPNGFVRNTFLNGYHPVFPWTAYALVGMWLAQRPIFDPKGRRRYLLLLLPITLLFEFAISFPGFLHKGYPVRSRSPKCCGSRSFSRRAAPCRALGLRSMPAVTAGKTTGRAPVRFVG